MTSIANSQLIELQKQNIWVNGKKEVIIIYLNKAFKQQNPANKTINEDFFDFLFISSWSANISFILWLHKLNIHFKQSK